jgi:hypothetical protein
VSRSTPRLLPIVLNKNGDLLTPHQSEPRFMAARRHFFALMQGGTPGFDHSKTGALSLFSSPGVLAGAFVLLSTFSTLAAMLGISVTR